MIPTILFYHQIADVTAPEQDPYGLTVSPQNFERQMTYLHRAGFRCISLDEAVDCLLKGTCLPPKHFVLSFDDGYTDLYTTACPILQRLGFTATIFFVSGLADYRSTWDGQQEVRSAPLMSWHQARALAQQGCTFGSHTITHPRLPTLDTFQATREIRLSREMIQSYLATPIRFFSYPYCDFDDRIARIVATSGYTAACGGDRQKWHMFNLWRAQCTRHDTVFSVALKAHGLYHRIAWMREESPVGPPLRRTVRTAKSLVQG
ncbi:MAG: polysaccharide deacetylase family protein [Chloroflexaceae bacterium]|nr:polysaccharide deacetylase family protein [Chloroflexaceae bacterium]